MRGEIQRRLEYGYAAITHPLRLQLSLAFVPVYPPVHLHVRLLLCRPSASSSVFGHAMQDCVQNGRYGRVT